MERCKEYAIAHTTSKEYPDIKKRGEALEKDVNSLLEHGWQPIGGFTIDASGNMYQAIGYCPTVQQVFSNQTHVVTTKPPEPPASCAGALVGNPSHSPDEGIYLVH
jgi:hypothetical protein